MGITTACTNNGKKKKGAVCIKKREIKKENIGGTMDALAGVYVDARWPPQASP